MRTALCFESRGPSSCPEGGGYGFHKLPGQGSRQVEPDPFGTADAPRSQQLHSTIRKEWRKETQGRLKRRQLLAETISLWVSKITMAFFNSAVGVLQTLVIALGAGLGIWGAINLLEGYGKPLLSRFLPDCLDNHGGKPLNGHNISGNHRLAERNAR